MCWQKFTCSTGAKRVKISYFSYRKTFGWDPCPCQGFKSINDFLLASYFHWLKRIRKRITQRNRFEHCRKTVNRITDNQTLCEEIVYNGMSSIMVSKAIGLFFFFFSHYTVYVRSTEFFLKQFLDNVVFEKLFTYMHYYVHSWQFKMFHTKPLWRIYYAAVGIKTLRE